MSSSASSVFMGTSTYSQDLQNVISREVSIASLPITQLKNNLSDLTGQSSELQSLNTKFAALQTAVTNLSNIAGDALSLTSSDPEILQGSVGKGAAPNSYSVEVTDLGAYAHALSLNSLSKVSDPAAQSISSSGSYQLTVASGTALTLRPTDGSLNALAQSINNADAGVHAAVINVGGDGDPDYRLSLQGDGYGPLSIALSDGQKALVESSGAPGRPVQYTVNGRSVQSGSRSQTLAPGVTVNFTGTTDGAPATLTVGPDSTGIQNALSAFASAYNAAVDEVNHNRGQGGGALAGQSITSMLARSLHDLSSYTTGTSGISSFAALGLKFSDASGHLSFDSEIFSDATKANPDALARFLGTPDSGGFLKMATTVVNGIEDATGGSLSGMIAANLSSIADVNRQISDKQEQVDQLQQNLTQQMAAADALIASLQQQAIYFTNMFTAMRAAQTGTNGTAS
ncbi:MAG: flagellar filament capping protein FliD [Bryobacteraceae bacterium]